MKLNLFHAIIGRVTFLYWNINRKSIQHLIAAIAEEYSVDVIILAENEIPLVLLLTEINGRTGGGTYTPASSIDPRIHIFSRLPTGSIRLLQDYNGVTFRQVIPPIGQDILLVAAHLPSKMYADKEDQTAFCIRVARLVEEEENRLGHCRTVIIGDLNLNPFEPGVASADGFHGVLCRKVALKHSRTVRGENRRFFYNPMWGTFGKSTLKPPGTYDDASSKQTCYFWNVFDQVLIRPELLECFQDEDIEILSKAGKDSLLTTDSEIPDVSVGSDHLPLLCKIQIEKL